MKRIYLAGPMTGLPQLNFPAFHAEAARLRALGYDVVNPAELNPNPNTSWQTCMRVDIRELVTCDAAYGYGQEVRFAATDPLADCDVGVRGYPWRPSIHMPRWASRILLEITAVRVERVQDISDEQALAEGVDQTNTSIPGYARQRFQDLWESINGAGSWDANPWVWVVEFKRITP